jgi:hypothetical protein
VKDLFEDSVKMFHQKQKKYKSFGKLITVVAKRCKKKLDSSEKSETKPELNLMNKTNELTVFP